MYVSSSRGIEFVIDDLAQDFLVRLGYSAEPSYFGSNFGPMKEPLNVASSSTSRGKALGLIKRKSFVPLDEYQCIRFP